ncbi:hypothetical protein HII36_34395 [Nonomuraea sp. NN258]|uniref:hypothetical protein n=1 Tax=Nonomuraea antri TaxID=2730852 RepID=UPI001568FF48|nr:hypothetical protein [Nonomuraea antri]NRQ36892.1 hypothetical protein [Nonomuraea antri]
MHAGQSNRPDAPPGTGAQYGQVTPPARKPVVFSIAIWWSMAVAALYVFSAVLAFIAGRDALTAHLVAESLGELTDQELEAIAADPEVAAAIDEGYGILTTKAIFVLVAGLAVALVTWLSRNGAAWARSLVLVTTFLAWVPATILLSENSGLAVNKVLPAGTWFGAFFAVPLSLVVFVLFFLPPVNRYGRARKLSRR